jgi:hypothetical protein
VTKPHPNLGIKRIETDHGLRGMRPNGFRKGGTQVHRHGLDLLGPARGQGVGEEPVQGGGLLSGRTPHDLAGVVVGDQRQILVVFTPGNLVDPDVDEIREPVVVEPLGHDSRAHRPDRAPGHAAERRHRRLVTLGGQPDGELLEVSGKPRSRPRERHRFGQHTVLGATQPASPQLEHADPPTRIQVPPRRVHRPCVIAVPSPEIAMRT